MNEIIGGKRMCGKTTELIKRAYEEQLYILCPNGHAARLIYKQSQDMGLEIPYPITVVDLPLKGEHIDRILIDEIETVIRNLTGKHIVSMSTSYKLNEFESLRKSDKEETTQYKLSELGVSIFDSHGELRGIADILKDVENAYHEMNQSKPKPPLLTIELQDETSVPKVFYDGEEVTKLIHASMAWDTATDIPGGMSYAIECGDTSKGYLARERIERCIKAHV